MARDAGVGWTVVELAPRARPHTFPLRAKCADIRDMSCTEGSTTAAVVF
jgi:hypothetical protein